jgi:large subunit ribosomal protein L19
MVYNNVLDYELNSTDMANYITYNDTRFSVGDTIVIDYLIKEGEKERIQKYGGILLKVRGSEDENRMITVRYRSKSGIGMERIFPLSSPFIKDIVRTKETSYSKAKAYFVRDLSDKKTRQKLYRQRS